MKAQYFGLIVGAALMVFGGWATAAEAASCPRTLTLSGPFGKKTVTLKKVEETGGATPRCRSKDGLNIDLGGKHYLSRSMHLGIHFDGYRIKGNKLYLLGASHNAPLAGKHGKGTKVLTCPTYSYMVSAPGCNTTKHRVKGVVKVATAGRSHVFWCEARALDSQLFAFKHQNKKFWHARGGFSPATAKSQGASPPAQTAPAPNEEDNDIIVDADVIDGNGNESAAERQECVEYCQMTCTAGSRGAPTPEVVECTNTCSADCG